VDFLDGGTLGLDLLGYMEGYGRILIADCLLRRGSVPGAVLRVEAEEVEAVFQNCLSPHQMGLKDLLAVLSLQGRLPECLTVVGVEGKEIGLGTELSPEVEAAIPAMTELMADVLRAWGHEVSAVA
jgi:hydrogenase maturation protease